MSPIPFGTPTYTITLPTIDINLIGSIMLTVWQLANQNQILVVAFLLFLAAGALSMMIKFATRGRAAPLAQFDISDAIEDVYDEDTARRFEKIWRG